jgi:hypothetical protein
MGVREQIISFLLATVDQYEKAIVNLNSQVAELQKQIAAQNVDKPQVS